MPATLSFQHKPVVTLSDTRAGITLIELLICLAIISIVSFVAIPTFNDMYQNANSNSSINQLSRFIRYTQSEALSRRARVTLCPSSTGIHCEQDWHLGIMIFIDENNDQVRSEEEPLLRLKTPFLSSGKIHYNNPANKIVFSRQGFPLGSAGSFVYCPENTDEEYARALILSFQGRLRVGRDSNGDDVVETTGGKNVQCT